MRVPSLCLAGLALAAIFTASAGTGASARSTPAIVAIAASAAAPAAAVHDLVLRGGTIYDGSGAAPAIGDVAVDGDRIAAVGDLGAAKGRREVDARGLAVAPGFVNMLSWANDTLLVDGRAQSDLRQGVTLEVMGEGWSMGPLNEAMRKEALAEEGDLKYDIPWTTLGGYLDHVAGRGIAVNVASFVGATTVRVHEVGYADRPPTPPELERMRALVRQAMEEGALGVGSSLIYAPAFYARTDELVELAKVAGQYGGMYISHMRSEGNRLLEAIDELVAIARRAGVPAEIYHLKAAGRPNWGKLPAAIAKVEAARARGLAITADMYTYTAGATGLDAAMPPWVQEGGLEAWRQRLADPAVRARVEREMSQPSDAWENLFLAAGPENILLAAFKSAALKPLTGKTLAEVAKLRGKSPAATAMDLVAEDDSRVGTLYFLISEDNIRREVALPWVSFGSDEGAPVGRRGVPQVEQPSPRLRQRGAPPRALRPRREDDPAGRGRPQADLAAGGQSQARPSRPPRPRLLRRRRRLRSRGDRRPRDLREAAPVRDRRAPGLGQRHPGIERRRADGRRGGPGGAGTGLDGVEEERGEARELSRGIYLKSASKADRASFGLGRSRSWPNSWTVLAAKSVQALASRFFATRAGIVCRHSQRVEVSKCTQLLQVWSG